jgi:hypothetical protein
MRTYNKLWIWAGCLAVASAACSGKTDIAENPDNGNDAAAGSSGGSDAANDQVYAVIAACRRCR